jgi:hypothetical protein
VGNAIYWLLLWLVTYSRRYFFVDKVYCQILRDREVTTCMVFSIHFNWSRTYIQPWSWKMNPTHITSCVERLVMWSSKFVCECFGAGMNNTCLHVFYIILWTNAVMLSTHTKKATLSYFTLRCITLHYVMLCFVILHYGMLCLLLADQRELILIYITQWSSWCANRSCNWVSN